MIKKNQWSKEEEWILYICHRQYGNYWADIAQVLEGRTDNTIKNHWNSTIKRKLRMKGKELFKVAVKTLADSALQILKKNHSSHTFVLP